MYKLKLALSACLIFIIVLTAFTPFLKNDFVNWDDNRYVAENTVIKSLSLNNTKHIFTAFYMGNYHPITMLFYSFEYQLFKLKPFGYHLTSLLLHLSNCFLVFFLTLLLTGRLPVALLTGILWGMHPLNAESVLWISETKGLLCALFYLWSIICYVAYMRENRIGKYYNLSLLLFILALLAKPMAVSLPLMLFLIDYMLKRKHGKAVFIDKIPFFMFSAIFGVISVFAQYRFGAVRGESLFNFLDKIMIAGYGIVFYLNKILVPIKLACIYPYPFRMGGFLPPQFFLPPFIIVILSLVVFFSRRHTSKLIFGSLFFLIAIIPALQFVPISISIVADRYAYLASIGILYLLGEGIVRLFAYNKKYCRLVRIFVVLLMLAVMSILFSSTRERCRVWNSSITLWNDVLEKYPNIAMAHNQRGLLFLGSGEYSEAYQDFKNAVEISSKNNKYITFKSDKYFYLNLGNCYRAAGSNKDALATFEDALKLYPDFDELYFNIADIYDSQGDTDKAILFYKKTLQINPKHVSARDYLGALNGRRQSLN
ncbi:tetratricopeptide repeat protein [bacterium]|nr:MAG: tetratricopeptide repeat protein [bacterium]